jgi:dTDP-4-dehydrorhamnose 3,5-epimerase-like enzyme
MERLETRIEGPVLVRPVVHGDHRGFFHESYRREVYGERNGPTDL